MRRFARAIMAVSAAVAAVWGAGLLAVPGAGGVVAARAAAVPAEAGRAAGSWGRAMPVPGLAALNKGREADVGSVSCSSPGNCAIGGEYVAGNNRAFVGGERHGRWGKAIQVPGLAALSKNGEVHFLSLSCGSAGNCEAGGYYFTSSHPNGAEHSFVAAERHGRWGKAIQMPGLAALSEGGDAEVDSISCPAPGNCAATGVSGEHGFVAGERDGHWSKAIAVPGLAALDKTGLSEVEEASCGSAGNCVVVGTYTARSGNEQGFAVSERNGRWDKAIEIPGLAALNTGGDAVVNSVSCVSAGNCTAGGFYFADHAGQGFVASERNGRWDNAIAMPGLAALNKGHDAEISEVSCGSAGNCAAEGNYFTVGGERVFVASERNGRWAKAIAVPGLAALNTGGDAEIDAVSCTPAGICVVGGHYSDRSSHEHGFVAAEHNGVWGRAIQVPGLAALSKGGDAGVFSVSCTPVGTCTAGGAYSNRSGNAEGFVVTSTR